MTLLLLRSLFAHADWANARVFDSLQQGAEIDPHALEQYAHLLAAEHVWLARLEGRTSRVPIWPTLTLAECAALSAENTQGYARWLADARETLLAQDVSYRNSKGDAFTTPAVDILAHVAMHGAYHRGQISLMVRRSGGTPAPTDYVAFVRGR